MTYEGPDDHKYVPPSASYAAPSHAPAADYHAPAADYHAPTAGYEIQYMPYSSPTPMPYGEGALPLRGMWGYAHGSKSQLGYVSGKTGASSYGGSGVHAPGYRSPPPGYVNPTLRPAYAPGHYLPGLLATPHFNGRPSSSVYLFIPTAH